MNLSPKVDGESWMRILISVTTGFVAFIVHGPGRLTHGITSGVFLFCLAMVSRFRQGAIWSRMLVLAEMLHIPKTEFRHPCLKV